MQYKKIPKTDIAPSVIIMGSDGLGSVLNEKQSFEMLDRYIQLGGNLIDTANIYGYPTQESEKIIGRWLKERGCREKVIIGTKGAHPNPATMHISRLSREEIRADAEQSLENLKTDYIDLYWLHRDDENLDCGDIIETLNELIKEGKVREIGASNWKASRIAEANRYAQEHGLKGFRASQIKWSYAVTYDEYDEDPTLVTMDKTELEFYKQSDLAVFAYASQAKGFFSKYDAGGEEALSEKAKERYLCTENLERYKLAKDIASRSNISISSVILQYLINQPFPVYPIVGCRNVSQLEDSMKAADANLTAEDIQRLLNVSCEK